MTNDTPHGPTPPDESSRDPADAPGTPDNPDVSFDTNQPPGVHDSSAYGEDTEPVNDLLLHHHQPDGPVDEETGAAVEEPEEGPQTEPMPQFASVDWNETAAPDEESGSALFLDAGGGDDAAPLTDVVPVDLQGSVDAVRDVPPADAGPIAFTGDGDGDGEDDVPVADAIESDDDRTYADIDLGSDDIDAAAGVPGSGRTDLGVIDNSGEATLNDQQIPLHAADSSVDFSETDGTSSGSNLFADVRFDEHGPSGVDLSEPLRAEGTFDDHGGHSSIFQGPDEEQSSFDLPGMFDRPSDMGGVVDPPSSIYKMGMDDDDDDGSVFDMATDLDPPSELDMGALPAPPSSIFRPVRRDTKGDAWGDDGDEGSIFDHDLDDLTEAEFPGMGDDPSELDMGALPAPPSNIFRPPAGSAANNVDPTAQGTVSFDLPADDANQPPNHAHQSETSGLIDWASPPEDDELMRYSLGSTGATGPLHQARAEAGLDKADTGIPSPTSPAGRDDGFSPDDSSWNNHSDDESWADERPLLPSEPTPKSKAKPTVTRDPEPEPPAKPGKKKPKPTRPVAKSSEGKSRGGMFAGAAVGLLVGVAGCVGAYLAGVVPSGTGAPQSVAKSDPVPPTTGNPDPTPPVPAAPTVGDAQAWLAQGDAARALTGFDAAPADAPPAVRAGRGQARWLARVRQLAATDAMPAADDPELAKAEADLTAAADDPDAGVAAALHLGLLKEVAGDVPAAREIYAKAAERFPESRGVFDAALERLAAMQQAPAGDGRQGRLTPAEVNRLAHDVVLTTLLLQAEPAAAAPAATEPGVLYWKAVNDAAAGNFDAAIRAIDAARKRHDEVRLRHVGGGVNPQSDPLGQIFLRNADELHAYWVLKRDLYGHPTLGPIVKRDGVGPTLDTFASAATKAEAMAKEYEAMSVAKTTAEAKLTDVETKYNEMATVLTKAEADNVKATADLADARATLADRTTKLTAAEENLKAARGTVDMVVAELAKNDLIDKADPANLGEVVKRVAATAASGDAKKAAEALIAARKELDRATTELAAAKDATAKAEAQAKAAEDNVAKLVAAAKADLQSQLADQMTRAQAAAAEYAKKLEASEAARLAEAAKREEALDAAAAKADREIAAREAELRKQMDRQAADFEARIADIRSGALIPLTNGERTARDRAVREFNSGVVAYHTGRYPAAEELFLAATTDDDGDARYWYYLGLSRWAQGDSANAETAFKKGAELEARSRPASSVVAASLERIQGAARRVLTTHRP